MSVRGLYSQWYCERNSDVKDLSMAFEVAISRRLHVKEINDYKISERRVHDVLVYMGSIHLNQKFNQVLCNAAG